VFSALLLVLTLLASAPLECFLPIASMAAILLDGHNFASSMRITSPPHHSHQPG
jgi:hypothetical protein